MDLGLEPTGLSREDKIRRAWCQCGAGDGGVLLPNSRDACGACPLERNGEGDDGAAARGGGDTEVPPQFGRALVEAAETVAGSGGGGSPGASRHDLGVHGREHPGAKGKGEKDSMTPGAPLPLRFHCVLGADAPKTPFHRRGNSPKSGPHRGPARNNCRCALCPPRSLPEKSRPGFNGAAPTGARRLHDRPGRDCQGRQREVASGPTKAARMFERKPSSSAYPALRPGFALRER